MHKLFLKSVLFALLSSYTFGYKRESNNLYGRNVDQFENKLQTLLSGKALYGVPSGNICCANGQWEANAYLNAGSTTTFGNETVYFYYNGTGKIAFDEIAKKSFLSYSLTAFTKIVPAHYHFKTTVIKDFATGVKYEIDDSGNCSKEINRAGMEVVCVPQTGTLISHGVFGNTNVSTYQFSTFDQLEEITTTTVLRNGSYCEPVMVSYAFVDDDVPGGLLYDVDIVDRTQGIKDPSIFMPPKSCNSLFVTEP